MNKYGLIGWPVKHSVSPQMHNAAFGEKNIDAQYELLPIAPETMSEGIARLRQEGYAGWNATVPHKEAIIPFLDEIDPLAKALGSVNTIVNHDGKLKGYSTDGFGMEQSLRENFQVEVKGGRFIFIGAGGAARAVALHFAMQGAAKITIINRTVEKALTIAQEVSKLNSSCEAEGLSAEQVNLTRVKDDYDVLIQSTSLGLHEGDASPFETSALQPPLKVVDMIYKKTALLQAAEKQGCQITDGRGMLLHQGVKAWEIWTGEKAPVESMRQALNEALNG